MKVVQVVTHYPPHLGGMENVAREISERLAKKSHQVEVFTSDTGYKKGRPSPINNLKINYLKSWEFAHTPLIPSLFFRLLFLKSDTLIHLHVGHPFSPEIVYLISLLRNIRFIAHIHSDSQASGRFGILLPFYKSLILKRVLRRANKIIVPTIDYVKVISYKYGINRNKITVIPAGVDINLFHPSNHALHNPLRFLFVGRLSKGKNLRLLIDSFKKILKRYPNSVLKIVGDGEEKGYMENIIKKENLMNSIKLCGVLVGIKLLDVYRESDIFIFTSEYESFGLVLLEAIASGLPVIAPNIESVRTIIKNNKTGLLVKLTPEDFSKAVEKLLMNSKLREELIKNALEEVKKYNWDKIVSKFEWIYKDVIYDNNKK